MEAQFGLWPNDKEHQQQGMDSLLGPLEGARLADTDFGPLASRTVSKFVLSHQICGNVL